MLMRNNKSGFPGVCGCPGSHMRVAIHSVACCQDLSFQRFTVRPYLKLNWRAQKHLKECPLPSLAGLKGTSPVGTLS